MFSGMPTHESLKCSKKCPFLNFVMRVSSHFEWITAVRNFSSHSIYLPMTLFCAAKSKETKEVIERRSVTSRCHGERQKMDRFILAKQQLCSCITLFCTFLIRRNCDGEHLNFTRSLYGVCEHGAYIFFFFFQTQIRSLRIQPQKILPTFNKLNETE